jgi:hypothetical protein
MEEEKQTQVSSDDLKILLEKNLEMTQEVYNICQKVKSHMFWANIWSVFKIVVIIIPLIIGFLYLPPLLKNAFDQYNKLLNSTNSQTNNQDGVQLKNFNLKSLLGN